MDTESIVPDVIDTVPPSVVVVKYPSGAEVKNGNELTPTQVKDVPIQVTWPTEGDSSLYTLCMTDPDAPSRAEPTKREVKHWLVINIPGNKIDQGNTLAEYRGSGPPKGTGLHRYIFLIYKQPAMIDAKDEQFISKTTREGRLNFKIRDFAKKYNLKEPVAGNFYQAQWDEYVATLQQQTK